MGHSDGSITFSTALDNKQLESDLKNYSKKVEKAGRDLTNAKAQRLPLVEEAKKLGVQLDIAKSKLHEMQSASKGAFAPETITDQQENVKYLQSRWNEVQKSVEGYDRKISRATAELETAQTRAGEIAQELATAGGSSERMDKAVKKANKSMTRFSLRLKEVVRSAMVFTIITQSLAKFREWMGLVIKTNEEARAATAGLKASLLTLAQPLVGVLIPAFTMFLNVLTAIVTVMARLMAALFGTTYEQSKKAAQALNKEVDAIKGIGAAADEAAGSLAGFDEINTITTEKSATIGSSIEIIEPDFSAVQALPELIESLLSDLEIKIEKLRFSWDKDSLHKDRDAWIIALSGILGAVIGSMFGGISGGVIGLLLGASIGLVSVTFLDKLDNPDAAKEVLMVVLGAIIGAVLGTMFGGFTGGVIGFLLGALITLVAVEFAKGDASTWDPKDTVVVVLTAIIGAVLGSLFGGFAGGVIGFLLGATISFVAIEFAEGNYNKDQAIASLRMVLLALLGIIVGTMFGGFVGGILGLMIGLTVGFSSVAFDKTLDASVRTAAQNAFKVALTTIIGALIGAAFGGGVFGGIVGGVIGLTLGLAVTLGDAKIKNKNINVTGGGMFGGEVSLSRSVPALASGAVVPPNREFMAILGDNKTETEVVSPLSTMKQAMKEAMQESGYGGEITITVISQLDGKEVARNTVKHVNNMTRQAGKPVLVL